MEIKKIWAILGLLVTVSAVISLLQRGFDISLILSLEEFLEYYRNLLQPIYEVLHIPWKWLFQKFGASLPSWFQDVHTLSFICSAISMRAFVAARFEDEEDKLPTVAQRVFGAFFYGYTFIPIILLPIILFSMVMLPIGLANHYRWSGGMTEGLLQNMLDMSASNNTLDSLLMGILGWLTFVSVVGFFVINILLR